MTANPASTHTTCNRCGALKHRDQFRAGHRTCKSCNRADDTAVLRARRRSDPVLQAKERAWNQARWKRRRAQNREDMRWRRDWVRRTIGRLYAEGWSTPAIAHAANLCPETIRRWGRGDVKVVTIGKFNQLWRWVGDLRWEQERAKEAS